MISVALGPVATFLDMVFSRRSVLYMATRDTLNPQRSRRTARMASGSLVLSCFKCAKCSSELTRLRPGF